MDNRFMLYLQEEYNLTFEKAAQDFPKSSIFDQSQSRHSGIQKHAIEQIGPVN